MTYKPRNRNPRIDRNRESWSSAFDDYAARRKEPESRCGFHVSAKADEVKQ